MEPLPPPEWEIEPLFNQGDRVMFYGPPEARKSWFLMSMGTCLAAGVPWLGKFGIKEPRKVLYIDKEMGARRVRWRYERLIRGAGLDSRDILFQVWAKPPFMVDDEGVSRLLKLFEEQQWQPDVIIIDSFRRVLVGDENSSNDVNNFWNDIALLTEAGITLLLIHHTNRDGTWRGSNDILAGLDTFYEIKKNKEEGCSIISTEKNRDGESLAPFGVKLIGGPKKTDPIEVCLAGEEVADSSNKGQQAAVLIYQYLNEQPGKKAKRAEIEQYMESQGFAPATTGRALDDMKKTYVLAKEGHGYWKIAPEIEDNVSPAA
jgi:AAA domain